MHSEVSVALSPQQEFRFDLEGQEPLSNEAARRWLDEQFTQLECEPLRASGKVLLADKVLVVARGHPLARHKSVTFADTLEHDHIGMHSGSTLQAYLSRITEQMGRTLKLRIQLTSFDAMCRMIGGGVGIGKAINSPEQVAKGQALEAEGELQKAKGDVKQAAKETLDELTPFDVFAKRLALEELDSELKQQLEIRYRQIVQHLTEGAA